MADLPNVIEQWLMGPPGGRMIQRTSLLLLVGIIFSLRLFGVISAEAQDARFTAAKRAFETLDPVTRKAIQRDLIWVGSYNGLTDGNFGRLTLDAIQSHQKA